MVIEKKKFENSPRVGADKQPIKAKNIMSAGRPDHYGHLLQVYKESLQPLTLYTSFRDLIIDNPMGQTFDVNRNLLSLQSSATSYKSKSL